jgi:hypothetical protein
VKHLPRAAKARLQEGYSLHHICADVFADAALPPGPPTETAGRATRGPPRGPTGAMSPPGTIMEPCCNWKPCRQEVQQDIAISACNCKKL